MTDVPTLEQPDPGLVVESRLTAWVIANLRGCLQYFAPPGVSDEAIAIRAFEVARDASRMEPERPAID